MNTKPIAGARVLVTGVTGFLGKALVKAIQAEADVVALVRRAPENPLPHVTYVIGDLDADLDTVRLPDRIDIVFHLAARLDVHPGVDAVSLVRTNVLGTVRLLQYARDAGVRHFVYASSGGVYGYAEDALVEDEKLLAPTNLYGLSKYQGEQAVRFYARGFAAASLRYFFPYAAGTPNIMARWAEQIRAGAPVHLAPGDHPRTNPIWIDDAIQATIEAAAWPGYETVNVAGPDTVSYRQMTEMMARTLGRSPTIIETGDSLPGDLVGSTKRLRERCPNLSLTPLAVGLERWLSG